MRIPTYTATANPREQAPDPSRPLRVASAEKGAVKSLDSLVQSAQETHDKYVADRETAAVTAQAREFELGHEGQLFYKASDIPENVNVRRYDIKKDADGNDIEVERVNVPSHEVYPKMYAAKIQGLIDSGTENVPHRHKADWKAQMQEHANSQVQAMLLDSERQQQEEIRADQTAQYKESLLRGDYSTAMFQANTFNGSDAERSGMVKVAHKEREIGDYNVVMSEDDIDGMVSSLGYLKAEEYPEAGNLEPPERMAMIRAIESRLALLKNRKGGSRSADYAKLKNEAKWAMDALEEGRVLDPRKLATLGYSIKTAYSSDVSQMKNTNARWDYTLKHLPEMNSFSSMGPASRENYLNSINTDTGSGVHKYNLFRKMDDNINKRIADGDSLGLATDIGLVNHVPLDPNNIEESLQQRLEQSAVVKEIYGHGDMLYKNEVDQINNTLNDSTVQDQMEFISTIQGSLNEYSPEFWSQLGDKTLDAHASAGLLASQDRQQAGQSLLRGKEYRKNNPEMMPKKIDMTEATIERIGATYMASGTENKRAMDGIANIYADLVARQGDFSGELDEDLMDTAVEMYSGGIVSFGSSQFAMPKGFTEDSTEEHIRYLSPDYWRQIGVQGYQGQESQISSDIRRGDISLQQISLNEFLLYSNVTNAPLNTTTGGNLIFKFDHNNPMQAPKKLDRRGR